jgi:DegV family protein with EDD domain
MSPSFAIIVDGTAALPAELARELDISFLPVHVNFGDQSFTQGVDLSFDQFYTRLEKPDAKPTTSQPSLGECRETYEAAFRKGAAEILVVTLATELSGTYSAAVTAAQQHEQPIEIVDSRGTAGSTSLIATACARARQKGASFEETVALARKLAGHVKLRAIIDTLEQLKRSGRASGMQAMFGSLLKVKPIIKIENGKLDPIDKVRTREKAMARLQELVEAEVPPGEKLHASVIHTNAPDRAKALSDWVAGRYRCVELYTAEAGPAIATHGGPGVLGLCWYPESLLGS